MVRKALLVAVAAFTLYAVFIARLRPYWSVSQHQWQDNQIKAENYIYGNPSGGSVLVGSSLACLVDSLPGVYNLALSGRSLLDGLAIVTRHARPLRTVYIELNVIDRAEDREFTQALANPLLLPAKRFVLALRADKQPLAVLGQYIHLRLDPLLYHWLPRPSGEAAHAEALFDQLLAQLVREYARPPAPELLKPQFIALQGYVAELAHRGTQVVFFEMPIEAPLCYSVRASRIRNEFLRYFPAPTYRYVALPDCGNYHTRDGVHLNAASARRYTQYLRERL